MKTRFLALILTAALLLSACGKEKDTNLEGGDSRESTLSSSDTDTTNNQNQNGNTSAVFADAPTITPNDFNFPTISGLEGTLIFVQGDMRSTSRAEGDGGKIYMVSAEGGVPERITEHVYSPGAALSPNHKYLIFTKADGRHWSIYSLNISTRQVTVLTPLQSQFASVNSWSPDGNWMVAFNPPPVGQGAILAKLDGTSAIQLGPIATYWTTDNRLILLGNIEPATFGSTELATPEPTTPSIEILDPVTQERTPLDLGTTIEFDDPFWLTTALDELAANNLEIVSTLPTSGIFGGGLHYDGTNFYIIQQENPAAEIGSPAPTCDTWHITRNGEAFYDAPDTVSISDFRVEADGTAYMVRWYLDECRLFLESFHAELLRISPAGQMEVLQSNLYAGSDLNLAFVRATNGMKYAISPDNHYMAWISGSFNDRSSTLNIADLATGESIPAMQWNSTSSDNFLSLEAFTSVFWIE